MAKQKAPWHNGRGTNTVSPLLQGTACAAQGTSKARRGYSVARKLMALRLSAGLTQRQLAKLVGTTASPISRLEDADYEGHSLAMLNRIASSLKRRVEMHFVSIAGGKALKSA